MLRYRRILEIIFASVAILFLAPMMLARAVPLNQESIICSTASSSQVGSGQEVTATIVGAGLGESVLFSITSGPNTGLGALITTDANGQASWVYGSGRTGTDTIMVLSSDGSSCTTTANWTPPGFTLDSSSGSSQLGGSQTVTARLTSNGQPLQGIGINFFVTAGPNEGLVESVPTDANGEASFTYSSNRTGTDAIEATVAFNPLEPFVSNSVAVSWTPPDFTLTPESATNQVGSDHTVTAMLISNGQPLQSKAIGFFATAGPNEGLVGTGTTDANGQASFTYSSTETGIDTIEATVAFNPLELFVSTASKTWIPLNSEPTDIALNPSSVEENQPPGTFVGTFSTIDPDAGDTFTYSLVPGSGDTDNGSFAIVGDQLLTNAVFDFETQNSFSTRVRSTDAGGLSIEKSFNVNVTDVNEAPTDIALNPSSVEENQPTGTFVGTFSTVDPDTGDTFTYSLVPGTGDADNGSFTIVGDQLLTNAVFDFETQNSLSIRVRSTDAGGLLVERDFIVTVISLIVADAGPDQEVTVGNRVTLDGSGSSGPNGDRLAFRWEQTGGPTKVALQKPTSATPTFTPYKVGEYTFRLTVSNNQASAEDSVTVTALGPTGYSSITALEHIFDRRPYRAGAEFLLTVKPTDRNFDHLFFNEGSFKYRENSCEKKAIPVYGLIKDFKDNSWIDTVRISLQQAPISCRVTVVIEDQWSAIGGLSGWTPFATRVITFEKQGLHIKVCQQSESLSDCLEHEIELR